MVQQMILELPVEIPVAEVKWCLATKLFEMDRLSLEQAAELAGYSPTLFLNLLGSLTVPVEENQIERELASATESQAAEDRLWAMVKAVQQDVPTLPKTPWSPAQVLETLEPWPLEDLEEIARAIEEDCSQVDLDEW